MAENKTKPTSKSVASYLEEIEDPLRRASIVGFGNYRYKYASGREGDWFLAGFSSRKQSLTLYIMRFLRAFLPALLILSGISSHSQVYQPVENQHPAFSERVKEREKMVWKGIANYPYQPVKDSLVLEAMKRVPRHAFIPMEFRKDAYRNSPLLIGYNQTISQPFIVAHMTELLEIERNHKVLEVGTGSGYQSAVLGELCNHVYTIEIIEPLGLKAELLLHELGYDNIHVRIGDGYEGWPEEAPFDRIIVTCAPEDIPQPIIDQLSPGGRIVIPVGKANQTQYMVTVTKNRNGRISSKSHYPVRFVPMTGKAAE